VKARRDIEVEANLDREIASGNIRAIGEDDSIVEVRRRAAAGRLALAVLDALDERDICDADRLALSSALDSARAAFIRIQNRVIMWRSNTRDTETRERLLGIGDECGRALRKLNQDTTLRRTLDSKSDGNDEG
jgi:hypothetical protein